MALHVKGWSAPPPAAHSACVDARPESARSKLDRAAPETWRVQFGFALPRNTRFVPNSARRAYATLGVQTRRPRLRRNGCRASSVQKTRPSASPAAWKRCGACSKIQCRSLSPSPRVDPRSPPRAATHSALRPRDRAHQRVRQAGPSPWHRRLWRLHRCACRLQRFQLSSSSGLLTRNLRARPRRNQNHTRAGTRAFVPP